MARLPRALEMMLSVAPFRAMTHTTTTRVDARLARMVSVDALTPLGPTGILDVGVHV